MVKASGGPESGDASTISSRLYNIYICMFYFITCGWPICALMFHYVLTHIQICQARSNPYAILNEVAYTSNILTKMKTW